MRVDYAHHILGLRLNDWTAILVFVGAVAVLRDLRPPAPRARGGGRAAAGGRPRAGRPGRTGPHDEVRRRRPGGGAGREEAGAGRRMGSSPGTRSPRRPARARRHRRPPETGRSPRPPQPPRGRAAFALSKCFRKRTSGSLSLLAAAGHSCVWSNDAAARPGRSSRADVNRRRHPGRDRPTVHVVHHTHRDVNGGWLRPAVFGAMDGLVSNFALMTGVAGGRGRAPGPSWSPDWPGWRPAPSRWRRGSTPRSPRSASWSRPSWRSSGASCAGTPRTSCASWPQLYVSRGVEPEARRRGRPAAVRRPGAGAGDPRPRGAGHRPRPTCPRRWSPPCSSFGSFALGALLPVLPYLLGRDHAVAGAGPGAGRAVRLRRGRGPGDRPLLVVQRAAAAGAGRGGRRGHLRPRHAVRDRRRLTAAGAGGTGRRPSDRPVFRPLLVSVAVSARPPRGIRQKRRGSVAPIVQAPCGVRRAAVLPRRSSTWLDIKFPLFEILTIM